ncbi:unnamed protein product, partial [Ectocarpus sp. 12 AP-2014]
TSTLLVVHHLARAYCLTPVRTVVDVVQSYAMRVYVPLSRSTGRRGLTPSAKHLLHATHYPRRLLHTNRQCGRGAEKAHE